MANSDATPVPVPITSIRQPAGTQKKIPQKGTTSYGDWQGGPTRGLNGKFFFSQKGTRYEYRIRVTGYSYQILQIGDEGAGRNTRAYYPHATADGQFSITVFLIGYSEKESLMRWFAWYGNQLLTKDDVEGGIYFPWMSVILFQQGGKKFVRTGIPLTGMQFGDHVGAGWWTPTIIFESAKDPTWKPSQAPKQGAHPDTTNIGYFYPNAKNIDDLTAPDVFDPIVNPNPVTPDPVTPVAPIYDAVAAQQAAAQAVADQQASQDGFNFRNP